MATGTRVVYGKPGVGIYKITEEDFQRCCCDGLRVGETSFRVIGQPDCFLVARGENPVTELFIGQRSAAALQLALAHIRSLSYITLCRPTAESPNPANNFCQGKIPVFDFLDGAETENGFVFRFEVEDCGIPPIDYIYTIFINRAG